MAHSNNAVSENTAPVLGQSFRRVTISKNGTLIIDGLFNNTAEQGRHAQNNIENADTITEQQEQFETLQLTPPENSETAFITRMITRIEKGGVGETFDALYSILNAIGNKEFSEKNTLVLGALVQDGLHYLHKNGFGNEAQGLQSNFNVMINIPEKNKQEPAMTEQANLSAPLPKPKVA